MNLKFKLKFEPQYQQNIKFHEFNQRTEKCFQTKHAIP